MAGLDLQRKAAESVFHEVDERLSEGAVRHPSLYLLVEVVLLFALAALIYGLVSVA